MINENANTILDNNSFLYTKKGMIIILNSLLGICIVNHTFHLWNNNWMIVTLIFFLAALIVNTTFYLFWQYWFKKKLINISIKELISRFGICFIFSYCMIIFLNPAIPIPNLPASHTLEINARDGSEIRLGEIRIGDRKIPLKTIKTNGLWGIENKWLVTKRMPAYLNYNFITQQNNEVITVIYSENTLAGKVDISIDGHLVGSVDLKKTEAGETQFISDIPQSVQQKILYWGFRGLDILGLTWVFFITELIIYLHNKNIYHQILSRLQYIANININEKIIIIILFVYCLIYTAGGISPDNRVATWITTDVQNLAAYAAALDHPDLFVNDYWMSSKEIYRNAEAVILFPYLRYAVRSGLVKDYTEGFVYLILPYAIVYVFGYYYLGKLLYKSRFWALLFTIVTIPIFIPMKTGDPIGLYGIRSMQLLLAILPWLLAAVIKYRTNPKAWPWIMSAVGLLAYVHLSSFPNWAIAVWLSLIACSITLPSYQRYRQILLFTIPFCIIIAPIIITYFTGTIDQGSFQPDPDILRIFKERYINGFFDIGLVFKTFFTNWVLGKEAGYLSIYWLIGLIGYITILRRKYNQTDKLRLYLPGIWMLATLLFSGLVPLIDHTIAFILNKPPLEVDLVRMFGIIIHLLFLILFLSLSEIGRFFITEGENTPSPLSNEVNLGAENSQNNLHLTHPFFIQLIGLIILIGWLSKFSIIGDNISQVINCSEKGYIICWHEGQYDRLDSAIAIRDDVPPGAIVLQTQPRLETRYFSMRPLAFSGKDGAYGYYSSRLYASNVKDWYNRLIKWGKIQGIENKNEKIQQFILFAKEFGAGFIEFDSSYNLIDQPNNLLLLHKNSSFSLYKIIK